MWGFSSWSVGRSCSKRSISSRVYTEKVTEMVMEASSKVTSASWSWRIRKNSCRFYNKNERLGRLPYFHIPTFSLFTFSQLLPWTVISCFFCLSSQLNFHSLFFSWVWMRTHFFYSNFSYNKPLVWWSRCRDWWQVFYNLYFVKRGIQSSVMLLILFFIVKKQNKMSRNHNFFCF